MKWIAIKLPIVTIAHFIRNDNDSFRREAGIAGTVHIAEFLSLSLSLSVDQKRGFMYNLQQRFRPHHSLWLAHTHRSYSTLVLCLCAQLSRNILNSRSFLYITSKPFQFRMMLRVHRYIYFCAWKNSVVLLQYSFIFFSNLELDFCTDLRVPILYRLQRIEIVDMHHVWLFHSECI